MKKFTKDQKGFTIIEVLIVLAIAGLILLIVFLAVPALQRNSRNTQMKNAVSAVLGGISEFGSNNNGQLPTAVTVDAAGVVTISGAAGTTAATATIQGGYTVTVGTTMPAAGTTGAMTVYLNRQCNGNAFAAAATNRAVAIGYNIETGNAATANQCQTS